MGGQERTMSAIRMSPEDFERLQARNKAAKGRECPEQPKAPKRQKYGNTPTTDAEGIRHASKKQAARYRELGTMLKGGAISILAREVRFRLPGGIEYRADHVFMFDAEILATLVNAGELVVEDVKSDATRKDKVYRLKKKQMKECLGIEIAER